MAKTIARRTDAELYQGDFSAWAQRQARLLEQRRFDELDLERLIEEVADLRKAERSAVLSHARQIMAHFLKLQYSPATWPRRGWMETIGTQRMDLEERLSATLRRELAANLDAMFGRARRSAARDLKQDGVLDDKLPGDLPYTLEQILDPDWLPANVHGIEDPAA
jgi:Domain of unknown function DUF29